MIVIASTSRSPSRRDIQGLRAVAVIAVVLAHVMGWPRGGFAGVDVFFVVSGFLITGLLLREFARTGRISLREFYARRVRRILPAALLVLVVVVVAGYLVFNRARADQTLGDALAAAFLVSNWRFAAQGTDYFHATDALSPLQHFWSLSVEEQFYVVWPGLIVLTILAARAVGGRRPWASAAVGVVVAAIVVGSATWAFMQTAADPTTAYFSTTTRAWELAAGALLAVASPALARLPAAFGSVLGWVGLIVVVGALLIIDPDTMPFPAPWALLPVAGAAFVIAGGVRAAGGDPRHNSLFPLTNPISVFVGDISYSLYLWHFPVLVFAAVLLPAGPAANLLILATAVLLAVTTYFLLEQPVHRSPWLSRRVPGTAAERVVGSSQHMPPVEPAIVPEAPTARALSSRPADWTPGTRYYRGSRRRPASPVPSPIAGTTVADAEIPDPPITLAPIADPPTHAALIPDTTASWHAWRERYGAQMAMAAAALGIGAGAVVLVVQVVFGPFTMSSPGSATRPLDPGTAVTIADVQSELTAAVAATTWPALDPSLDAVIARSSSDNPAHDCFVPDRTPDLSGCTWGSPDAARHMYLVGDSSAMAYAPAFKALAEASGGAWRITTVGLYGCRFTDVLVDNSGAGVMAACPQRKDDVRAMIAANPADLVVVSNAYSLGHTVDGRNLSARELLVATQAEVAPYGATEGIVYLSPPPHGQDLGRCYSPVTSPAACLSSVESTWHDMQAAAESVASASGGHVIDALPFSCVRDVCPAFAGTVPIRYDDTHLTVAYAERIAPILRANLQAMGLL